ncbi:class II glutamine amidotransferase [Brachybacterium rhamnosum]|uniref:Class II glutamine amidotransferase n=1 Tax=Brachybacterium rhamnosum TaxID=173361 RepID=A0ABW4PY15_9MICO
MCRLLGVVSFTPRPLERIVPAELPLFTALSERHKDGWGVAWYPDPHRSRTPELRKGTDTALASNAYGDAVAEAHGEVIAVHLRRASVGLALELTNTHPFVEGEVTFSHNGQFDLSPELRERILARGGRRPEGTTDSELFLSLITAHARKAAADGAAAAGPSPQDWALAVQRAAAELTAWLQEIAGRPPESLNCLLTTPDALIAFAQHDPAQAPADQPREVYDLRWRQDTERVLVSSTGYERADFATLPQGGALSIGRTTLAVTEHPPL